MPHRAAPEAESGLRRLFGVDRRRAARDTGELNSSPRQPSPVVAVASPRENTDPDGLSSGDYRQSSGVIFLALAIHPAHQRLADRLGARVVDAVGPGRNRRARAVVAALRLAMDKNWDTLIAGSIFHEGILAIL